MTRLKLFTGAAGVAALCTFGWIGAGVILPQSASAWQWVAAAEDPVQLTRLGLATTLTSARVEAEVAAALAADDVDLAGSFLALADQQGLPVAGSLRARHADATTAAASAARSAREFYAGLVAGEGMTGAGLAGVVAGDLTGVSDIRDLVREGRKIVDGQEPDQLVLGLAAAGLALTGVTIASVGAALPARAGVSTVRVAAKSGRLSKPLAAQVASLASDVFDPAALRAGAAAAARLEVTAAKSAFAGSVRPAALTRLRFLADDVSAIGRRGGVRAATESLAIAENADDLRRLARVADTRGPATRAVLKTLGRGAIAITAGLATMAGWVLAGAGYVWLAFLVAVALSRRLLGVLWWTIRTLLAWRRAFSPQRRSHAPR